jgi:phenylacetate 2-hydroxylase
MAYPFIALVSAVVAVGAVLLRLLSATDVPKIKGIPAIPGVPIFGNLLQLGNDHARIAGRWAKRFGPVFQARLGNKVSAAVHLRQPNLPRSGRVLTSSFQRVIFVNSYDAVRHFWITHQSSLISRPTFHTFHSVVSSSQGFTIGTSPWDDSCKRRRKAAGTALNRPAVQSYMPILDLESTASIKELWQDSKAGERDLNPTLYFNRFALNTSLMLNYGFRIQGNVDDKLLNEIVHVERIVSNFRSTSNNWQDYVPLLRLWSVQNKEAKEYRERRDAYLELLLGTLKKNIANGVDKPCITGNILRDPEAKLNDGQSGQDNPLFCRSPT